MGFIHEDPCEGVHIESRQKSISVYTDYGIGGVDLEFSEWKKVIEKIHEILLKEET